VSCSIFIGFVQPSAVLVALEDSFLKSFEMSINKLRNVVHEISNIKEKQILHLINDIHLLYLFDYEIAFSKRWVRMTA
jgi:hypothetical protein